MRAVLRYLLAGMSAPPPLPRTLWATLGLLAFGGLNWLLANELWPHTPAAKQWLLIGLVLLSLALWPQLMAWSWRWLRAYAGPGWVRLLAMAAYLGVALVGTLLWVGAVGAIATYGTKELGD